MLNHKKQTRVTSLHFTLFSNIKFGRVKQREVILIEAKHLILPDKINTLECPYIQYNGTITCILLCPYMVVNKFVFWTWYPYMDIRDIHIWIYASYFVFFCVFPLWNIFAMKINQNGNGAWFKYLISFCPIYFHFVSFILQSYNFASFFDQLSYLNL